MKLTQVATAVIASCMFTSCFVHNYFLLSAPPSVFISPNFLQEAPAVQTPPDEARSQQRKVEKTVSFNVQPLEEIHFNSSDVSDETQSEGGGSEGSGEGSGGKYVPC